MNSAFLEHLDLVFIKINLIDNETEERDDENEEETEPASQDFSNKDQSNLDFENRSSSSENNSLRDESDAEFNEKYFYIDNYDKNQLKELVKLFVLKVVTSVKDTEEKLIQIPVNQIFSLPRKLWIEKQENNEKETGFIYDDQILEEDRITDFIEDTIDATSENIFKDPGSHIFPYAAKFGPSTEEI